MAIDWGGRRVGVALSDLTQTIARPLCVLDRGTGYDSLSEPEPGILDALEQCARKHEVSGIVFGVPYYHLSGDDNPKAPLFLMAGRRVGIFLSLPVFFSDEGQTSDEALEMISCRGKKTKKNTARKSVTDHLAAASLLQRFLDESNCMRQNEYDAGSEPDRVFSIGKE